MYIDSMTCWLCSVDEVKKEQQLFTEWLVEEAAKVFIPGRPKQNHKMTITSYVPASSEQNAISSNAYHSRIAASPATFPLLAMHVEIQNPEAEAPAPLDPAWSS
jgi:hypothetical protein